MILALIPAYEEEKSIAEVITSTSAYADKIVVIDDGSTDKTGEIAERFGATVLHHPRNMGVGVAMRTGIDYAKKVKPTVVVTIDADGQHNPKEIPHLIQPILSGHADFVLGSRFLRGPRGMPFIKRVGNLFLSLLVSLLIRERVRDAQTGFRALNSDALMAVSLEGTHTYVQEMIIDLCRKGYRLHEVPITVKPRKQGSSKVTSSIIKYVIKTLPSIFHVYVRDGESDRSDG